MFVGGAQGVAVTANTLGEGRRRLFTPAATASRASVTSCRGLGRPGTVVRCGLLAPGDLAWVVRTPDDGEEAVSLWRRTASSGERVTWQEILTSGDNTFRSGISVDTVRTGSGPRLVVQASDLGSIDVGYVAIVAPGGRVETDFGVYHGGADVVGDQLDVRFPIYRDDDPNQLPSGGLGAAEVVLDQGVWVYRKLRKL